MPSSRRALALVSILVLVALVAWGAREANELRIPRSADLEHADGWFCGDPDSHYHMRRLERTFEEGLPVAETDPWMNFPEGARIPWPPYYTYVLRAVLGPFAPHDPAERLDFIERAVASVPCVFGVLTALVAVLAAWRLAGSVAAIFAGLYQALLGSSIYYSIPGNGDHHAWVSFLTVSLFATTMLALAPRGPRSSGHAALHGALAGALAGLLVGSWVGGLMYVLLVQVVLGLLLLRPRASAETALPAFGLAFHLALALAILPAVLSSPWKSEFPWMVVNLSWFHLAEPLIGALVFLPLFWLPSESRARAAHPWIVGGMLALAALVLARGDFALAREIRAGFSWAGRTNEFMAFINESQPLLGGPTGGLEPLAQQLGYGALLVAPVWLWAAWRTFARGEHALAMWVVAVPPLLFQALLQRRFADAAGAPTAVLLGWGAAEIARLASERSTFVARLGPLAAAALAIVLQTPTLQATRARLTVPELPAGQFQTQRGYRELYEWLRDRTPSPPDFSVLATWDKGHAIEWVAERPSVGTNFGSYLGLDSYLDPWRFFLSESSDEAEALLERRRSRYVLVHGEFTESLEVALRLLRPAERDQFRIARPGQPTMPAPRYYRTMVARLMSDGNVLGGAGEDSLEFLRLVHVAPTPLGTPVAIPHVPGLLPCGWIWERVRGAVLEARGAPESELAVGIEIDYASLPHRFTWSARARAGSDGVARVRVPYATDAPNGDVRALGPASWTFDGRSGRAVIRESDVLGGSTIAVP